MDIRQIPCRRDNYGGNRTGPIRYLVVHYTAGFNDHAENNGIYFSREYVGASAHYFVDDREIVQSVPDDQVAWHCGGRQYFHPQCRNGNSIGVEMCTRWTDGQYWITERTQENTRELLWTLMQQYDIPPENVIRHYDVTHKCCPAPFCGAGEQNWVDFKEALMRYWKLEDLPDWGRPTITDLMERDLLRGGENGLDLSRDMLRLLVILDRAGMFKQRRKEEEDVL